MFAGRFSAKTEATEKKQDTFIIYNLSLLAIIQIIENVLPISLSLVQFLPLFILVVIWAGHTYVCVRPQSMLMFMVFAVLTILVPPYAIFYIFMTFLQ